MLFSTALVVPAGRESNLTTITIVIVLATTKCYITLSLVVMVVMDQLGEMDYRKDGRDGTNGQKGIKGERGEPGILGQPGSGAPGIDGHDGTIGQKGDKGGRGESGMVGPPGPVSGGATYTRCMGRTSCPNTAGTSLVYSGRAGKSWYSHKGGGGNYQCLPNNPEYGGPGQYAKGVQGHAPIYGVEYQIDRGSPLPVQHNHNVPCAVCHVSTRAAVLMIPAWRHCPSQWTLEYTGYLMTEGYGHGKATYECVDKDAESIPGSHADTNGGMFHHVEANCNGLPCPPYDPQKELTCAVCTKCIV